MEHKDMHITVKIFHEADIAWLPKHTIEKIKYFIDLSGDTTPEEVDTLLRALIDYNNFDLDIESPKDVFLKQMLRKMDQRNPTLPGGIHFEGNGYHIYPGCCCGMEQWREIADRLGNHESPWMGHDPDVSFLEKDGLCYIANIKLKRFSSGKIIKRGYGMGDKAGVDDALRDKDIKIIGFYPEEFHHLLERLDQDFKDFLNGPLQRRMEQLAGDKARPFVRAFAKCFRRLECPFENRHRITLSL